MRNLLLALALAGLALAGSAAAIDLGAGPSVECSGELGVAIQGGTDGVPTVTPSVPDCTVDPGI
jgi:hypothetical protein